MQTVITRMPWGEIFESSIKVNRAVNPLEDLRQIIAQIREEHNCKDDKLRIVIGGAVNQLITQNPNIIAYVCTYMKDRKDLVEGVKYGVTAATLLGHELNLDVAVDHTTEWVDNGVTVPDVFHSYIIKVDGLCDIDVSGVNNG